MRSRAKREAAETYEWKIPEQMLKRISTVDFFLRTNQRLAVRDVRRIIVQTEERRRISQATVYKVFKYLREDKRFEVFKLGDTRPRLFVSRKKVQEAT